MRQGLTLVLGGGGFKGLAHLGVLRVLQAEGLPIARVVGTSAGALIGATWCYFGDAERALEIVRRFLASPGFRRHGLGGLSRPVGRVRLVHRLLSNVRRQVALERLCRRSSAFGSTSQRFIVRSLVPKVDISELKVPLAICAMDLVRGEELLLLRGPLTTAVTASGAVPGYFPPVEWEGRLLCDPGIIDNLPTGLARRIGAQNVVAVDLSAGLAACRQDAHGLELLLRAQEISTRLANRRSAASADVVVAPDLGARHWLDTSDLEGVMAAGEAAAVRALPEICALLRRRARRAV